MVGTKPPGLLHKGTAEYFPGQMQVPVKMVIKQRKVIS